LRIKDTTEFNRLISQLVKFDNEEKPLPGIVDDATIHTLAMQIIDSQRRIKYINTISYRSSGPELFTPYSGAFDPLKGAAALQREGNFDEAFWLTFVATHFSKHSIDGWRLTEDVYGKLGQGGALDWSSVVQDRGLISNWFNANYGTLTTDGTSRRFGNHRKYESLRNTPNGTASVLASYVDWVMEDSNHMDKISRIQREVGQNPEEVFSYLYKELNKVRRMGRLGKFDFLCNLSNLGLAPIAPDKAYIKEATGPKLGAILLFGEPQDNVNKTLEDNVVELGKFLGVNMQVMEDSLCNWQKSPATYVYFRG